MNAIFLFSLKQRLNTSWLKDRLHLSILIETLFTKSTLLFTFSRWYKSLKSLSETLPGYSKARVLKPCQVFKNLCSF